MRRVVLLPGLDGTGTLFAPFLRAAPPGVRLDVVALPPEPLGYAALAERLAPALELTPDTVLVGESFSGPLAVALAARHPVAALVLCNSFVAPPRGPALRALAVPHLFRVRPPVALVRRYLVGPTAPDALVAGVRAAVTATPPAVLAARLRSVLSVAAAGDLARCTAPILYLRGTEDRLVPGASVAAVVAAARVPVSVVRLAGPHLLLQAAPDAAWGAIRDAVLRPPAA